MGYLLSPHGRPLPLHLHLPPSLCCPLSLQGSAKQFSTVNFRKTRQHRSLLSPSRLPLTSPSAPPPSPPLPSPPVRCPCLPRKAPSTCRLSSSGHHASTPPRSLPTVSNTPWFSPLCCPCLFRKAPSTSRPSSLGRSPSPWRLPAGARPSCGPTLPPSSASGRCGDLTGKFCRPARHLLRHSDQGTKYCQVIWRRCMR